MAEIVRFGLPDGDAFKVAPNGNLDAIISGIEEGVLKEALKIAATTGMVRDPFRTADLDMLAQEYGYPLFESRTSKKDYQQGLSTAIYKVYRTGSDSDLETALEAAGFTGIKIVKNHKSQDPRLFSPLSPVMWCGAESAYCGSGDDYVGEKSDYEVLVNGDQVYPSQLPDGYDVGDDPNYWGYVDFVCGGATYDGSGNITDLQPFQVAVNRKNEFKRLCLQIKPLHNWLVLVVEYVAPFIIAQRGKEDIPTIAQTGDPEDDTVAQTGA